MKTPERFQNGIVYAKLSEIRPDVHVRFATVHGVYELCATPA